MTYPNRDVACPAQTMGSSNTIFNKETRFDLSYLTTVPGVLKFIVIVLNLLGFICVQSSAFWSNSRGIFFNLVAHLGLWFSGILLLLYLFHLIEKFHSIKWLKIEMTAYVVLTFLNLIASTIAVAYGSAAYSAGGFFGYLASVTYGIDAFLKARAIQAGELAQGTRVMTKQTHIVTPPALP